MDDSTTFSVYVFDVTLKVMGHMDVVSIVSDYFNIYFPILLIILTVSTYLSLGKMSKPQIHIYVYRNDMKVV